MLPVASVVGTAALAGAAASTVVAVPVALALAFLASSPAHAVLLARAGQDLTRYGQHWSHVAWAYRSDAGPWRVVHLLNVCGSSRSVLMRQGLGEFFLDDV